jgi:hypothetical protein
MKLLRVISVNTVIAAEPAPWTVTSIELWDDYVVVHAVGPATNLVAERTTPMSNVLMLQDDLGTDYTPLGGGMGSIWPGQRAFTMFGPILAPAVPPAACVLYVTVPGARARTPLAIHL